MNRQNPQMDFADRKSFADRIMNVFLNRIPYESR